MTSLDYLIPLQNEIAKVMLIGSLVIGTVSNTANIFVFLQKGLRQNPCSWYFIAVSIGHLIFFFFGCLPRVVTLMTGFDLTRTSLIFCQIRPYFLALGLLVSRHFLCLISIDRWLITSRSAWLRQLSSLKIVRWIIIISTIVWVLFSLIMPFSYRIEGTRGCVGASDSLYPLFYAVYNLATILFPLFIMVLFSFLIVMNLRGGHRTVPTEMHESHVTSNVRGSNKKRRDNQLIKLSLTQGVVYILLTTLYAYTGTYNYFIQYVPRTRDRIIIDNFITLMGINLMYFYMAITFFLYTLVSKTFRQEFKTACHNVIYFVTRC